MQEDKSEYPPGYLEADEKYNSDDYDPAPDSVVEIWEKLDAWHDYEKGYPKVLERLNPDSVFYQKLLKEGAQRIEEFKARLAKAAFDGDRVYFENLLKAIDCGDRRPEPDMNGIRAAIKAFENLFSYSLSRSKDDWPTKQEVRKRAEEILREAGRPIPGERQWPRIFRQAGLASLPSVTYGRARKRKKN
jgi:hypothetical protein